MNIVPMIKKALPVSAYRFLKKVYYLFNDSNALTDFNIRSIHDGHQNITYRDVKAIRCPFDYVIYQMIVSEVQPDLIIEIGTHRGGGALYLADLLNNLGKGVIHTIDVEQISDEKLLSHPRIKLFTNGWENYDLKEADGFEKILVIEDGAHTYECSNGAIKKFAPLVTIGSYLIVEDGIVSELGLAEKLNGGPLKAIYEFLKNNEQFVIDRKWCDFFGKNATFNVDGYLKRVK